VKLIDVNLLLYAINEDAPRHLPARNWLEEVLSGTETVALAWNVLLAFLRLSTRPVVFPRPLKPKEAFDRIESWLSQPCVTVVHPTDRHARVLKDLILPLGTAGNLTTDAHLAALALEHGAQLCSCDLDFSRFPGLHWFNPLEGV
jgi:toxin-antitoxin system PIN domain toxin